MSMYGIGNSVSFASGLKWSKKEVVWYYYKANILAARKEEWIRKENAKRTLFVWYLEQDSTLSSLNQIVFSFFYMNV